MGRVRLGIIGCGGMEGTHERACGLLSDRMEVAATVDIVAERAARAAGALGARRAVTDFREILDDVDAVMIVLPHDVHHAVGMECLGAGKHVLMEKPLAVSEAQCLELIHAADAAKRVLMTGYVMRYHPVVVRMKELLDARAHGDCFQVSIWTEQHTEPPAGSWQVTEAGLGGGQLFSHGCHYVDILLWYLGRPVRGTHLGTRLGTPRMEREGTSNVCLEFEGGPLGYHFGTWGAKGSRLRYSFHAHCTGGMLEARFYSKNELRLHTWEGGEEVLFETSGLKQTERQLAHFLDCVEQGTPPRTPGHESLQGLRVIWRLYEAERRGVVADLRGLGLDEPWDRPGLARLEG